MNALVKVRPLRGRNSVRRIFPRVFDPGYML